MALVLLVSINVREAKDFSFRFFAGLNVVIARGRGRPKDPCFEVRNPVSPCQKSEEEED